MTQLSEFNCEIHGQKFFPLFTPFGLADIIVAAIVGVANQSVEAAGYSGVNAKSICSAAESLPPYPALHSQRG